MAYRGVAVNGVPDAKKRCCYDCSNLEGYLSWWCVSEEANKRYGKIGTITGGVKGCEYWKPIPLKDDLMNNRSWFEKLFNIGLSDYYIEVDCSKNKTR